jgi:formate dehydrogenase iron-sulfur subunit
MKAAILTDLTKCVGCEACAMACKEINGLPKNSSTARLSATNWTAIERHKGLSIRRQCMHCETPACASACPVGALTKTAQGPVTYDADKCMGCRYCMVACPFQVPKYEWDNPLPKVQKCIMCYETCIQKGQQPACTSTCPTGATIFGDRNKLIAEAYARIEQNPDKYEKHIYGIREAGGTSVLYLSSIPFVQLGFPHSLQDEAYPELTWKVLSKIPNIVSGGGALLFGVWWIINRRIRLEEERSHQQNLADEGRILDE